MQLECISTIERFEAVREAWDRVYMADADARYFLSWDWLHRYFKRKTRWLVLALREDGADAPFVAFFPLRLQTPRGEDGRFFDEIIMAGNYAADYTGFVALPAYEKAAIRAFAGWLAKERWMRIKLDYFCGSPERRNALVRALSGAGLRVRTYVPRNEQQIDNTICPAIDLPESWETYLQDHMSAQSRQKLRRFLRKVDDGDEFRITMATKETISRDLGILFDLWNLRWAPVKGEQKAREVTRSSRQMLMDCFEAGSLDVPVLWHGERPLGVLANIVDRQKMEILFYVTGRDEEWKTPSPGLILHGHCIRQAISEGFRRYDFLRGNEPYKYMFGVTEIRISCTHVVTIDGRNRGALLNPRSIRHVYEQALSFYRSGRKPEAEMAFRQVVEVDPLHLGAAYGLATLMFERGLLAEAETAYRKILSDGGDRAAILRRVADIRLARSDFRAAVALCREACQLEPQNAEGQFKLGIALSALRKFDEAQEVLSQISKWTATDQASLFYIEKAKHALLKMEQALTRKGAKPLRTAPAESELALVLH